jgi:hypothetical protein
MAQLAVNLVALVLSGVVTLYVQRRLFIRRRRRHRSDGARVAAGLPVSPQSKLR